MSTVTNPTGGINHTNDATVWGNELLTSQEAQRARIVPIARRTMQNTRKRPNPFTQETLPVQKVTHVRTFGSDSSDEDDALDALVVSFGNRVRPPVGDGDNVAPPPGPPSDSDSDSDFEPSDDDMFDVDLGSPASSPKQSPAAVRVATTATEEVWQHHQVSHAFQEQGLIDAFRGLLDQERSTYAALHSVERGLVDGMQQKAITFSNYRAGLYDLARISDRYKALRNDIQTFLQSDPAERDVKAFQETFRKALAELDAKIEEIMIDYGCKSIVTLMQNLLNTSEQQAVSAEAWRTIHSLAPLFTCTSACVVSVDHDVESGENTFSDEEENEFTLPDAMTAGGKAAVIRNELYATETPVSEAYGAEVVIPINAEGTQAIVVAGTFTRDPANLLTLSPMMHAKRQAFETVCGNIRGVPLHKAKAFLNLYNVRDYFIKTPTEFRRDLQEAHRNITAIQRKGLFRGGIQAVLHNKSMEQIAVTLSQLVAIGNKQMAFLIYEMLTQTNGKLEGLLRSLMPFTVLKQLKKQADEMDEIREQIDELSADDISLEDRVLVSKMPIEVKARALALAKKANEKKGPFGSGGLSEKDEKWLKGLLSFPWGESVVEPVTIKSSPEEIQARLAEVEASIRDHVHGHQKAIDKIMKLLGQWIANDSRGGASIGLQGPPGNGKTTLAKAVAKALGRPLAIIPLGGLTDANVLIGHSITYVGSTWGRVVGAIMQAKKDNAVILFDELDKLGKGPKGEEIIGVLTHLTDTSQNTMFHDKYFDGIDFDLSRCLFFFTYNNEEYVDPILQDRMDTIRTKGLSLKDKITIAHNYVIPDALKTVGLPASCITFSDEILRYMAENYTAEAGVRRLKEKIFDIVRETNLERLLHPEMPLPVVVDKALVHKCLKKPRLRYEKVLPNPVVGSVNGLFATAAGTGGLTIIQAFAQPAREPFDLRLTGSQGEVMQESMETAKTVAWNLLPEEVRGDSRWATTGLHLHVPEAAVKKDGPSAGAAITTAMISRITGIPIRQDVAMTGEIDLRGNVRAIGGLPYKLKGAKRAGAKLILVPEENARELKEARQEYPEIFTEGFEVRTVRNIYEVLETTLMPNKLKFQPIS